MPALDGIRGLAILGVLMLHSSIWGAVPAVLPGGNLGVTVFFVLSGYLITRLLLEEHGRTGRIDLRAFYLRRVARLLPALLLLLPVYVLVFARELTTRELLVTVGATLLYLSSLVQSIWGAMGNLGWTWSLSVEEHFYIVWPPLLRRLLGARSRARALALAGLIALLIVAAATILRIALAGSVRWNEFAYYCTPTRIDALAVGCLLALLGERRELHAPAAVGWAALAGIVWCYLNPHFAIGGADLDLYGLPLATLAGAVLIQAVVARPAGLLARFMGCRPLAHLGTISYGLYLWNLLPGQTFHVLMGRHPGVAGTLGCAGAVLALVELSHWYVERPIMRWARSRMAGRTHRPARRRRPVPGVSPARG